MKKALVGGEGRGGGQQSWCGDRGKIKKTFGGADGRITGHPQHDSREGSPEGWAPRRRSRKEEHGQVIL